jgi:predicted secreted hydrolase
VEDDVRAREDENKEWWRSAVDLSIEEGRRFSAE